MDSTVFQVGFTESEAIGQLKRLLGCYAGARWQKLDGYRDRYCLLQPTQTPGVYLRLWTVGQVQAACAANMHLRLGPVAWGEGGGLVVRGEMKSQSVLPGVR